jgi:diguanylate cyclase (GGDEF)-like protein
MRSIWAAVTSAFPLGVLAVVVTCLAGELGLTAESSPIEAIPIKALPLAGFIGTASFVLFSIYFWVNPRRADSAVPATPSNDPMASAPMPNPVSVDSLSGFNSSLAGSLASLSRSTDSLADLETKNAELRDVLRRLKQSRAEIHRQNQELKLLANRDPLTKCLNRRSCYAEFQKLWEQSIRLDLPICVIMVDVDHFKRINDTYGHATGDKVLAELGELLRDKTRNADLVCRYGGEEFCIVLPNTAIEEGTIIAERIRSTVEANPIAEVHITASLGVSVRATGVKSHTDLLDQADQALYLAKKRGRNQVVVWSEDNSNPLEEPRALAASNAADSPCEVSIPYPVVTALTAALAYRDPLTAEHSRRVAEICVVVARDWLGPRDAYLLEVAALLHDIGKLGIPESILHKPGALSPDEWAVMRSYDRIGLEIISAAFASERLTEVVRTYPAWWDGSHRRKLPHGDAIPLPARILALADAFDSMTSDQPHRKAKTREEAISELRRCAGTQFDPAAVDRFVSVVTTRYPAESPPVAHPKPGALRVGMQLEHLADAIDRRDLMALASRAGALCQLGKENHLTTIANAAEKLRKATTTTPDWLFIVRLTAELQDHCRAIQVAYLKQHAEETGKLPRVR